MYDQTYHILLLKRVCASSERLLGRKADHTPLRRSGNGNKTRNVSLLINSSRHVSLQNT
jgi:hypothetical protein